MTSNTTTTMPRARNTAPKLAGIDGLRGVAALAVLVYHVQRGLNPSSRDNVFFHDLTYLSHGVTLFFVLSGFLLYRPFAGALLGRMPHPYLRRYFVSRFLRIFPAYLVVLWATSIALRTAFLPRNNNGAAQQTGALSWPDLLLASTLAQGATPRSIRSGLEVAWTLGVELSFYILLPAAVWLAAIIGRRCRGRLTTALIPPCLFLALGLTGKLWLQITQMGLTGSERVNLEWGANWGAVAARSILIHADLFAYGMLAALALHLAHAHAPRFFDRPMIRVSLQAIVLAVTAGLVIGLITGPFTSSVVAIAAAALLLLTATASGQSRLYGITNAPILRWCGIVSFSVYLWHLPVIRWLHNRGWVFPDTYWGLLTNIALILSLTLLLAAATYYAIEAPALRMKDRHRDTRWPRHA
ncbi:Peptidoglycan/LPS O-acetylase OafA/YrhL, contains acyltransferase and SGNH-hydrolase domains [Cryobacterium flavum]|uniref:Peptidoglycan/LPS O-acetylase OafA/YrhL, contains acyltransferase and SGNH-hydrolase domains n=2 Tax=Cryobacterium flavum TaxID=1424659 RepID=A0A5E9G3F4_9MICO|nr:acyltransferase [Cryobacterium flavum]SDO52080.1 Peptidoglycan/LPS O-acetylase OafA/YrhL, contains acyltransferase and SGNH-hydrolase domains [Cryobacterium flavum]